MDPFVSILGTEDVAAACRRGEPVLETVTDVAIGAFVDLGIDPVANPPRLESIERDEDEYGEFWKVTFRIPERGRGGRNLSAAIAQDHAPSLAHARSDF
jgi:hypothetical protein